MISLSRFRHTSSKTIDSWSHQLTDNLCQDWINHEAVKVSLRTCFRYRACAVKSSRLLIPIWWMPMYNILHTATCIRVSTHLVACVDFILRQRLRWKPGVRDRCEVWVGLRVPGTLHLTSNLMLILGWSWPENIQRLESDSHEAICWSMRTKLEVTPATAMSV